MTSPKKNIVPTTLLSCGRTLRIHPAVWAAMMREARTCKRWASTADPEKMCIESQRAIERYKAKTVEALAADHYVYFHHRSHLSIRGHVIDPPAVRKWKALTGRKPIFFKEKQAG